MWGLSVNLKLAQPITHLANKRKGQRNMAKKKIKRFSPKLTELSKWTHIEEVNKQLDQGVSPAKVCKWINQKGFSISQPLIYDYDKIRKQAIVEGIQVTKVLNPIKRVPVITDEDKHSPQFQQRKDKVKNELDVLDQIIHRGYNTLQEFQDRPIPPKLMMDAISLKNNLTKGGHMNLTDYGIAYLKELEQGKFQAVLQALMSFIPEEKRDEAIQAIEKAEDEYYKDTDYYEEYLTAKEQAEQE